MSKRQDGLRRGPVGAPAFVMPFSPRWPMSGEYLDLSLGSLAAQTSPEWALVLVVDPVAGQTVQPQQLALVHRALQSAGITERTTVLPMPAHGGPGAARNAGVAQAAANGAALVLFADADDLYDPRRLARTQEIFVSHPEVDMLYSTFAVIDEHSLERPRSDLPPSIKEILDAHGPEVVIGPGPWESVACQIGYTSLTSTVVVRTTFATSFPFPQTSVSEDFHTWVRMFAAARAVAYLPDALTSYRVPHAPTSGTRADMADFYWAKAVVDADGLFRVLLAELGRGAMTRPEAEDLLRTFWARSATTAHNEGVQRLAETLIGLGEC